jgi:hypothetical protein
MSLAFHTPMLIVYEKYNERQSGACNTARIKSTRIDCDIDWEPVAFCTWRCVCKKYEDRMGC